MIRSLEFSTIANVVRPINTRNARDVEPKIANARRDQRMRCVAAIEEQEEPDDESLLDDPETQIAVDA